MRTTDLKKAKAKATKKATTAATKAIKSLDIDYKKAGKTALKVIVPLVVLKMIHSKYKKATKKTSHWEDAVSSLYKEVKSKLKDLK